MTGESGGSFFLGDPSRGTLGGVMGNQGKVAARGAGAMRATMGGSLPRGLSAEAQSITT